MLRARSPSADRTGVILLVVIALLTLFAAVGVTFVLYAEAAVAAAQYQSQALSQSQADVDPELLLTFFLGQLLYDAADDESGVYSALRGHSLARNLYGGNFGLASRSGAQPAANLVAFNGTGRQEQSSPFGSKVPGPDVSDLYLINYTYYGDDPQLPPGQRFVRDPERLGWRADLSAARGPFAGGFNAPYTYPDLNASFLAAVRADGSVLLPSFHRPWAATSAGAEGDFYDRATGKLNPLWSAQPGSLPPWFQYTTLRPLPALNPGFPPPEDGGGDIKNLMGPGTLRRVNNGQVEYWNNDSYWIDLDFPILTAPSGRLYKPLFAPLIVDLDNRINVNVLSTAQVQMLGQASTNVFSISDMEALLRSGDIGWTGLTADLLRQFPSRFPDARSKRLVTTYSFDLGRPGVSPWIHDPTAYPYEAPATTDPDYPEAPQGPAIGPPTTPIPSTPIGDPRQPNGDFNPIDGRGLSALLGRVDLNRPLPPYPHQGSGQAPPFGPPLTVRNNQPVLDIPFNVDGPGGPIWKQFLLAHAARQQLANDIYRRLLIITGVPPIHADQNPSDPPSDLLRSRRWLAQLAVNIVDYIDEDDISTPLLFYTADDYRDLPGPLPPPDPTRVSRPDSRTQGADLQWPMYWVFGTEAPRVLVNEALAEIGINDPNSAYVDRVRVFIELQNLLPTALPVPLRMGTAGTGYAPYQVLLGVKAPVPQASPAAILPGSANDNVLGNSEPGTVRQATTDNDFLGSPGAPAPGFYLLGPPLDPALPFAAVDPFSLGPPAGTPVLRAPGLEYTRFFTVTQRGDPPDERSDGVTVALRRLANPYLPFDGQRGLPASTVANFTYNPYLTVDYVEGIALQAVNSGGALASTGKFQPYAAYRRTLRTQTGVQHPVVNCTFGRPNLPAPTSYDLLTHLDRAPSGPLDLLQVSGYQPYQLTQRFLGPDRQGNLTKFAQRAPWLDDGLLPGGPSHRLYRLFEFLETGADLAPLGRRAGKVNLNTVWDPEIFRALCNLDPNKSSTMADDVFSGAFYDSSAMAASGRRTLGLIPGPDDQPFKGYGPGAYPPGAGASHSRGIDDTLLRLRNVGTSTGANQALDLLTKMAGQVTTRSNVFAVWLTVGFFEVTDTATRPAKLGAEIGRAEGRQIRHRMFAIVDRSNLSIASCVTELAQKVQVNVPYPQPLPTQTIPVKALKGTLGISWQIDKGTLLVVDAGPDQETVEVLDVNTTSTPPTIRAVFAKPHAAGAAISLANVAGPPPLFLTPLAVTGPAFLPGAPYVPVPPYPLTLRVAVDLNRSSPTALACRCGDDLWSIQPGTKLILDVGPMQEVVSVESAGFALDRVTATGTFQIAVARPHADGFLITNTFLGNPGPQSSFDRRHPSYTGLVRYFNIIQ